MVCDLCPSAEAARPSGIGDRIRDALARLDPKFAYAAGFDKAFANIQGSSGKRSPNGPVPEAALLVRPEVASARLRPAAPTSNRDESNTARRRRWSRFTDRSGADREPATATVFWICRDRRGSAGEGVRGHFERSWPIVGAYSALTRVSERFKVLIELVSPSGFEPETY